MVDHAEPISTSQSDLIDPARVVALQAALGLDLQLDGGDPLPPFYHQIYFWTPRPPVALGRDGHPKVGGVIPDMGFPRRMWAGGRLSFQRPLLIGQPATKVTVCESAVHKVGRSGPLGLVTLRHEIIQADDLCLTEWQDLVYREDPEPGATPRTAPVARKDEEDCSQVTFDSTLLFRYSALTFNGHRIHYDLDYARNVEGYDGLVVHGPLLAQMLMLMATDTLGPLRDFSFRATSPLMHWETAALCRRGSDFWVRGPDGRQCMEATASAIRKTPRP
jgi:3-methylfumaryl-CoA hydratase